MLINMRKDETLKKFKQESILPDNLKTELSNIKDVDPTYDNKFKKYEGLRQHIITSIESSVDVIIVCEHIDAWLRKLLEDALENQKLDKKQPQVQALLLLQAAFVTLRADLAVIAQSEQKQTPNTPGKNARGLGYLLNMFTTFGSNLLGAATGSQPPSPKGQPDPNQMV
jgi:hypothetical protein